MFILMGIDMGIGVCTGMCTETYTVRMYADTCVNKKKIDFKYKNVIFGHGDGDVVLRYGGAVVDAAFFFWFRCGDVAPPPRPCPAAAPAVRCRSCPAVSVLQCSQLQCLSPVDRVQQVFGNVSVGC